MIFGNQKNNLGFTLIEMILALFIFVMVIVIVANIFVVINNSQRKVATMQKIQDDVRYIFESITQEIRLGTINYAYYTDHAIDLYPSGTTDNTILALINQSQQYIFYRLFDGSIQYCSLADPNGTCDWQDVTPIGVTVTKLTFVITPSADPFVNMTATACTLDSQCSPSYRCDTVTDHRCEYFTGGHNFQPHVTVLMKSEGSDATVAEQSRITMQTTVSSRLITSKVLNDTHD